MTDSVFDRSKNVHMSAFLPGGNADSADPNLFIYFRAAFFERAGLIPGKSFPDLLFLSPVYFLPDSFSPGKRTHMGENKPVGPHKKCRPKVFSGISPAWPPKNAAQK